jgi:hypothetical protein
MSHVKRVRKIAESGTLEVLVCVLAGEDLGMQQCAHANCIRERVHTSEKTSAFVGGLDSESRIEAQNLPSEVCVRDPGPAVQPC